MQIDPRRLAVLLAVSRAGGVLAAASALHLTPSAVSQHIARLEAETGVTLLDRSQLGGRRAAGLTVAGRMLARHAERLAEVLAAAEEELAAFTGTVAGPVTVGAFPTAIRHIVAPVVGRIAATAPTVSVRVVQIEPEPGRAGLRTGQLDLLIHEADAAQPDRDHPGLRVSKLLDDAYRIVVPAAWGPVTELEALRDRPWVDGPPGAASRGALDRLAAAHGVEPDRRHECLEFPAVLALVESGLAAAVVPMLAMPERRDALRVIATPHAGARRLDLVHRSGRHEPSIAARLVVETLRARAAEVR